jgi:hypothetical protein
LSYLLDEPAPVASYFAGAGDSEAIYDPVNWGTGRHVIELGGGIEPPASKPAPAEAAPPVPGARRLARSPAGDAAIYLANGADGTRMWLGGGAGRPLGSYAEIWRANEWISEIRPGRAEPVAYTSISGAPLTAWLLLPPGYTPGVRIPMVTIVYPGNMYGATEPGSFSLYRGDLRTPAVVRSTGIRGITAKHAAAEGSRRFA